MLECEDIIELQRIGVFIGPTELNQCVWSKSQYTLVVYATVAGCYK